MDMNSPRIVLSIKARAIILASALMVFTNVQIKAQQTSNSVNQKETKTPEPKSNLPVVRLGAQQQMEAIVTGRSKTEYVVTAQHTSRTSGIHHMYLRQAINGIEVFGTESSIHKDAQGNTVKVQNNFVTDLQATVRSNTASLSASEAINSVAQQMGYPISDLQEINRKNTPNQEALYNKANISISDIPAKLMYYYRKGMETILVWELSVEEKTSADWWNFRVDASTGIIIDKDNFTVSCISEEHHDHDHGADNSEEKIFYTVENAPSLAVGSYNVIAMPLESPGHGGRTVVANPDNATASPFGWHDTNGVAGAESEYTIGNNCDAYDDRTSTTSGTGSGVNSERAFGGPTLTFSDTFNPNVTLNGGSIDAAVTNLFYWTNIVHDLMYIYGFDEASGNFQVNNYGNGGVGNDSVRSEAQDGSGTCNANFSTPTDGGRGRMQMYVCNTRDGDFDNGVVAHEYGHGISTRLTGGAGNSSCLNNQEQMGEGWSDFFGLIMTIESGDLGTDSRGMGTWLVGEPITGPGIRTQPYDTDDNTYSYDSIKTEVAPHGVGSVWAMMLWEMTWRLIDDHGVDSDIYNFNGNSSDAGNVVALALVIEGLKLQGCSPGFIDGRDAILSADQAIYGGANSCTIWEAFAARGLGFSADQGLSSSKSDGTEAFDLPPGTGSFASSIGAICITEGVQTGLSGGTPTGGIYSGVGVTDDGNGNTFTFDPNMAGVGTATVTYAVSDACSGGGTSNYNDTIEVSSGDPTLTCQNATVTLDGAGNASITWPDVVANFIPGGYVLNSANGNSLETFTGSATSLNLGDDNGSSAIPLPFNFEFYSNSFSEIYVASNGFISFTGNAMTGAVSRTPTTLPTAAEPNNMIAVVWDDLDPSAGGTITYEVFGSAPNRKMVVEYLNVPYWNATETISAQAHLYEGTNVVEIHLIDIQSDGGSRTLGLENSDGTDGITHPVTNLGNWTSGAFTISFTPQPDSFADNCGNSVTLSLSQSAFTCTDVGTNTVTVTADDGNGGISTCMATVTVEGTPTTFSGGVWDNGTPNLGSSAKISQNYNTGTFGSIDACSCEIDASRTLTVAGGDYLNVDGNITVDGTLVVEHEGSVVQIDDNAVTTNNGTINVLQTTPTLASRDFMILGSPMTGETRGSVWSAAFLVLDHNTSNFVPHPDVEAQFPGAENFADDNNDFWSAYAGAGTVDAARGYLVRPQAGYGQPGGVFNYTYDDGTLNTGDINFTVVQNTPGPTAADDKNASPNVLANPYPSAIFADDFINANSMVDEVYFWEHLTPPSTGLPGAGSMNFSMEDISMYNLSGGVGAGNPEVIATRPNGYISTGQGFGIKATAAGTATFTNAMRRTTNNNTLRGQNDKDRVWISVENSQYEMGGATLLAFNENATAGIDSGYDSRRLATVVSLYTHLEDGSEQLGIQTREAFGTGVKVPVGFSTQLDATLDYKISIATIEGENLDGATVYLIDNYTNTVTNLSQEAYAFTSEKGTFHNRFILQFEGEVVLGTNDDELESLSILPNPTTGVLNIISPFEPILNIEIFDVRGRLLNDFSVNSQERYTIDISDLESAVYFITVNTINGSTTKRILKK